MLFRFVEHKRWYFLLSGLLILPGVFFLAIGGLKLGVEFRGGTLLDVRFENPPAVGEVKDLFGTLGHPEAVVQGAEGGRLQVRAAQMEAEELSVVQRSLGATYGSRLRDVSTSTVSPSFSATLIQNAIAAISVASVFIVLLIAF